MGVSVRAIKLACPTLLVAMVLLALTCNAAAAVTPQVAAGGWHTAVLKADGSIWVWGYNGNGQLGLGSTMGQKTPVRMGTASDWVKVACGRESTFAIKADGTLWAWGWNGYGQLGVGDQNNRIVPTLVGSVSDDWIDVTSGFAHTVAIKANGTLWAWGSNSRGQLGQGTFDASVHPVPLRIGSATNWAHVSACPSEGDHTLALTVPSGGLNALYAWGKDNYGQLGDWSTSPVKADQATPQLVSGVFLWTSIAAGDYHSAACRSDGSIYTWGLNDNSAADFGQLGFAGLTDQLTAQPLGGTDWSSVVCTSLSTLALKANGSLFGTGCNGYGTLGLGNWTERIQTFTQSAASGWTRLAGGRHHVVGLKTDGTVWTWGRNDYWQLGLNDAVDRNVPTAVGLSADDADATPPSTTATVSPSANAKGWNGTKPVTVRFRATDNLSGVALTQYSTDGGAAWTSGASCVVVAEGDTVLRYRSVDRAGNVETAKTVTVKIDTVRPQPVAVANATVKRGRRAALRFSVSDSSCPSCTVKIVIRDRGGRIVRTSRTATVETATPMRYTFTCRLAKGAYSWYVYATDLAGNTQSKPAARSLTVN